ncbi:MAG: Hpt domain-containing protein [Oscillospiraceae bacterium]|jgi:HPt (histidine-containing phosphotransfer) domain-containing protein|nr:Hpt domain-containing protein [Oscillospiraceae bacterium]
MTLKECYAALGGNYEDVLGRLRAERLVQKFLLKFLDDKSLALLEESLEKGDYETAFRASHTLKGVCQNLGFSELAASSEALTEAMRGGKAPDMALAEAVKADYQKVIGAVSAYQAELG